RSDEVAQPVVHVGIVHVSTGGQHVRVAAHDGARPGRDEFVGQVGRVRKRAVRSFQSPVQIDDDVVDLLGGLGDRLDHPVLHLVFGGGHAGAVLTGGPVGEEVFVHDVGGAEQGDALAVALGDVGCVGLVDVVARPGQFDGTDVSVAEGV